MKISNMILRYCSCKWFNVLLTWNLFWMGNLPPPIPPIAHSHPILPLPSFTISRTYSSLFQHPFPTIHILLLHLFPLSLFTISSLAYSSPHFHNILPHQFLLLSHNPPPPHLVYCRLISCCPFLFQCLQHLETWLPLTGDCYCCKKGLWTFGAKY